MKGTFEHISRLFGSEMPRRDAMRAAAVTILGAAAAPLLPKTAYASQEVPNGKKTRSIAFSLRLPSGERPVINLADRFTGRLTYKGETVTFVPNILGTGYTEVSIYRENRGETQLATRITLPVTRPKKSTDAPQVPVELAFLPGFSMAAIWERDVKVLPDYTAEADCSVSCCWGGSLSGGACCCDLAGVYKLSMI